MAAYGPNLDDPAFFERRPAVPILDVHTRHGRVVDEDRLRLVAQNSNARAVAGDPALMIIGHTVEGAKETEQPPVVGYARNFVLNQWDGRACIFADLFYDKSKPEAFNYPRRSVEVFYSDQNPTQNYVDSIALLIRASERPLGLVSYGKRGVQLERYSMATADLPSSASVTEADIPALEEFMRTNSLRDWKAGLVAFLQAKTEGSVPPTNEQFTQADIPAVEKYMKQYKLPYEGALERYKSDKRAGTLYRT